MCGWSAPQTSPASPGVTAQPPAVEHGGHVQVRAMVAAKINPGREDPGLQSAWRGGAWQDSLESHLCGRVARRAGVCSPLAIESRHLPQADTLAGRDLTASTCYNAPDPINFRAVALRAAPALHGGGGGALFITALARGRRHHYSSHRARQPCYATASAGAWHLPGLPPTFAVRSDSVLLMSGVGPPVLARSK